MEEIYANIYNTMENMSNGQIVELIQKIITYLLMNRSGLIPVIRIIRWINNDTGLKIAKRMAEKLKYQLLMEKFMSEMRIDYFTQKQTDRIKKKFDEVLFEYEKIKRERNF